MEMMVVLVGEITEEYEGGLYELIGKFGLRGDRDAVIDVFDKVVAYYDDDTALSHDIEHWYMLYTSVRDLKGTKNVELSIITPNQEESE